MSCSALSGYAHSNAKRIVKQNTFFRRYYTAPSPRPPNGSEAEQMCKVLNKHRAGSPAGAIYIGRSSQWGNPFRIGQDGDRATVIAKYERWLADQHHLLRALDELRGHDLVCFCAPLACHDDLLLRLASASREDRVAWWRGQIDHPAWRCG